MGHPGGLETVLVKARFFWEHELTVQTVHGFVWLERTSLIC